MIFTRIIVATSLLVSLALACMTTPTATPKPTATPTPIPQQAFSDGYHRVGIEIAPGNYWLEMATPSPGKPKAISQMTVDEVFENYLGLGAPICSWIILNKVVSIGEATQETAVSFDQFRGHTDTYVVTIGPQDKVFSSESCGTWVPLAERQSQLDEEERERLDRKWQEWKKLNEQQQ